MKSFNIAPRTYADPVWRIYVSDDVTVAELLAAAREFSLLCEVNDGQVSLKPVDIRRAPPTVSELGSTMFAHGVEWSGVDETAEAFDEEIEFSSSSAPVLVAQPIDLLDGRSVTAFYREEENN